MAQDSMERRVNGAVDRAAEWVAKQQAADGTWWLDPSHPLGRTALSTYALLHAGRGKDDPAVKRALTFLGLDGDYDRPIAVKSTYEAGCLLLLLHALGPKSKPKIHRICKWLVETVHSSGLWAYPAGTPDLSNTQYAVMGLKVGMLHDFKAPPKLWTKLEDGTLALQHASGAFRYNSGTLYRATMTHAALLSLSIAEEALGKKKPESAIAAAIEKGHQWYEKNYMIEHPPFGEGYDMGNLHYYLYGIERYATWFGKKTIGEHDWYKEGATFLLDRQNDDGSWGNVEQTCFAILFLRKVNFTESASSSAEKSADPAAAATPRPPAPPRPDAAVPYLTDWLLAGPFPSKNGEDDMLRVEHFSLKNLAPIAGGAVGKAKWEPYAAKDKKTIEVGKALGEAAYVAFYAATYLHVEQKSDLSLWFGSDDGARVFLDGKEILNAHHHDHSGDDHYRVDLALDPGLHLLLVKIENVGYFVYFRARLTNPDLSIPTNVTHSTKRKK